MNPEYYLGNDLNIQPDKTIKVSLKKYIKEVITKHEKQNMERYVKKRFHMRQKIIWNWTSQGY